MSLRGRSYSILIVSAAGSLTSAFADLLPEAAAGSRWSSFW